MPITVFTLPGRSSPEQAQTGRSAVIAFGMTAVNVILKQIWESHC